MGFVQELRMYVHPYSFGIGSLSKPDNAQRLHSSCYDTSCRRWLHGMASFYDTSRLISSVLDTVVADAIDR